MFNGGPGAASAYLQLGAMGPWRLPLDGVTPSSPSTVVPNAETWLDFTDLVFVDPVGAGYSRFIASGEDVRKHFWSVDGDIDALSTFMRKWIEKNGRQAAKQVHRGRKLWRLPRAEARLAAAPRRLRGQRTGDGLAGARFRLARQRPALAARLGVPPALDGGDRARSERAVRPRSAARGRALRERANI